MSPRTGNVPSSFCAGKASGNYVDPNTCTGYISCVGNVEYKMPCPKGLWYNPKTDQCDYPKNVDCGGKTVFEIRENNHCGGGFFTLILSITMW